MSYENEKNVVLTFMEELRNEGYIGYITGGHAFKKHFNENEKTSDWDIHIYLTPDQMRNNENYHIIYNIIENLYKNYKRTTQINLYKLSKFDYAKWAKKYIKSRYRKKETEYYNSNVICDIQLENRKDTYVDISLSCCFDIDEIEKKIENNYISKESLVKDISKYYEDLKLANEDESKILKVKNRLVLIKDILIKDNIETQ